MIFSLIKFVNILFVLVYLNKSNDAKRFTTRKNYLRKGIVFNYNAIINGKTFMSNQLI